MSMDVPGLREKIEGHLQRAEGRRIGVAVAEVLAGGACQENIKVELEGGERWVLRSDARSSLTGSLDRARELEVIRAAVAAGVRTPPPKWPATGLLREGATSYFLEWREGEAIGRRVVKSKELEAARGTLPAELARELAKIHGIRPADHPTLMDGAAAAAPSFDPAVASLARLRARMDSLEPSPSRELVHRWLADHLPAKEDAVLCHGDFRTGNFLVAPDGLSAILDWEFAHWGARAFDLAWICVRDWRFGQLALPVGGFAGREPFYAAYEAASGVHLDRARLHWWEVFGNLAWAVGSVQQAHRYISGAESDLELVAIGRRAAEMEFEALRLIEKGRI